MAHERETKTRELNVDMFAPVWIYRASIVCLGALFLSEAVRDLAGDGHWFWRVWLATGSVFWWWVTFSALRIAHHVAAAGMRITIEKKPNTYSVKVAL